MSMRLEDLIDLTCDFQKAMVNKVFAWSEESPSSTSSVIDDVTEAWRDLLQGVSENPATLIDVQIRYWQDQLKLCCQTLSRLTGAEGADEPVIRPAVADRRFVDPSWDNEVLFDFVKQSYLLTSRAVMDSVDNLSGIDPEHKHKLNYYARQLISAMSPTNFAPTNPEVLKRAMETQGESLLMGLKQFKDDLENSSSRVINVCMSRPKAFQLGENIATTEGSVVFENELIQLIQYRPMTEQVGQKPLLLIPSWVNKYYIMDLAPKNSLIRWAVENGRTVFAISWVNPDARYRDYGFDEYMKLGPLAACDAIRELTGVEQVDAAGYCLGGVLLTVTLAYLAAKNDNRIASGTYLTTSVDFSDPGELKMFINDRSIRTLETVMEHTGYMDGRMLSAGFNLLKENELFWNYYVLNYLKGERPGAFDLLHWNTDNTHVPARLHQFVLRKLHVENGLMTPGAVEIDGVAIDLHKIQVPVYFLSTEKDHIAKWESTYAGTALHGGPVRFVLSGSGHIAGVINPPAAKKYFYYTNSNLPATAQEWLDGAHRHEGSWWTDWLSWLNEGDRAPKVPARVIDPTRCLEAAPGRYAQRTLQDIEGTCETEAA